MSRLKPRPKTRRAATQILQILQTLRGEVFCKPKGKLPFLSASGIGPRGSIEMSLPWASRACGTFIAIQDSLEGAMTADLVPETSQRGVAYGTTGAVNGVGDFISSTVAGVVWSLYSPVAAFVYAAVMMAAGAVIIRRVR